MRMIGKFNKMIRNRTLWGIFAALVSISFVAAFAPGGCDAPVDRQHVEGRLFDENISHQDFLRAQRYAAGLRESAGLSEEERDRLRRTTWQRMALLRKAEALNATVSDRELNQAIRENPAFRGAGNQFDRRQYEQVVQNHFRVPAVVFEDWFRQELTLQRMSKLAEISAWTAPSELEENLREWSDKFTLEYAVLEPDILVENMAPSPEQAREYFRENEARFAKPQQMAVRYVHFSVSNYVDKVSVAGEEVERHYERYRDTLYLQDEVEVPSSLRTRDELAAAAVAYPPQGEDEAAVEDPIPIYHPLESVRDEIEKTLREERALERARHEASDFVLSLAPSRFGPGASWEQAVRQQDINVQTSSLFAVGEAVPDLPIAPDVLQSAVRGLDPENPQRNFSDAVLGADGVYVLSAHSIQPGYVPEFEEVKDAVMAEAQAHVARQAFENKAEDLAQSVTRKMEENGLSFANALAALELDLTVESPRPFSIYEEHMGLHADEEPIPHVDTVLHNMATISLARMPTLVDMNEKKLLVRVADRQPGDAQAMAFLRYSVLDELHRQKAETLFEGWSDALLATADFEDLAERRRTEQEDSL